jgi:hypothetical protein
VDYRATGIAALLAPGHRPPGRVQAQTTGVLSGDNVIRC